MRFVVSDAHVGLVRAIAACLPGAGWQCRVVHLERDVCSLLASRRNRAMAAKTLQAVFRESDPATVRPAYRAAIDAVGSMSAPENSMLEMPRLTPSRTRTSQRGQAPHTHQQRARRMNRKIRCRARVVQVFPSTESMQHLVGAMRADQDEDWSSRRYISPGSMLKLSEPSAPEPVESKASRRRGLMIVETAMELAGIGKRRM